MKKAYFAIFILIIIIISIYTISLFQNNEKSDMAEEQVTKENEEILFSEYKPVVVREPVVAGAFYPSNRDILLQMINEYFNKAQVEKDSNIRGLVLPHAGYIYSGLTAAHGVKALEDQYETVIIIAPSHHLRFNGASIANVTHYRTPLGDIELSSKVEDLREHDIIVSLKGAHSKEHSVEVELPFLQHTLTGFKIVPIVTGNVNPSDLADIIDPIIDDKTLVVASTDLSHYYKYDEAIELDKKCLYSIPNLDFQNIQKCEACGIIPVLTLMKLAERKGWEGKVLDYRNSGDTAGTKDRVVGYTSISFSEKAEPLTDEEKQALLSLARKTMGNAVKGLGITSFSQDFSLSPTLEKITGCFVTLSKNDQLRGCIGHIEPREPLWKCVQQNAVNAALNDHRFLPVSPNELEDISIEISVLTPPEKLEFSDQQDLLNKLVPEKDGVVLVHQGKTSTYLPQVWGQLKEKELFLSSLCQKQGSAPDCWKSSETEVYIYHDFIFSE